MLREIADARQQLIAKSEAEIAKQVERLQTALTNMSQGLCLFDPDGSVPPHCSSMFVPLR
jgi:hypothetical protein